MEQDNKNKKEGINKVINDQNQIDINIMNFLLIFVFFFME